MITAEEGSKKYLRNSMHAFLGGSKTENWIMGVITASATPESLQETLSYFAPTYQNQERFEFLRRTYAAA